MRAEQFPIELRQTAQWILWKRERRGDKIHKAHFNARTGKPASSTDPNTWSTFEDAVEGLRVFGEYDGLGFVFSADDRFVGVDLDDCVDEAGEIAEWAREIVAHIRSYAELSQSGRGIHAIAIGDLPPEGRKKGPIEMYSDGRFFVMTGNHLPGTPTAIEPREDEILALHRQVFGANGAASSNGAHPPRPLAPPLLTDEAELIEKARAAHPRFDQLWRGDWSGYTSQSEADLALLGHLAFWCARDTAAMDRLFRQSGLCREKWTKREYYRNRTLAKAVADCREVYTPRSEAPRAIPRRTTISIQPTAAELSHPSPSTAAPWSTAPVLLAKELAPLEWVVPGVIPEGLTVFGGRPKQGKSWGIYGVGLAVATGGRAFGKIAVPQGEVLYLALEDGERRLQARMLSLLKGEPAPEAFSWAITWPKLGMPGQIATPESPDCLSYMQWWLDEHPAARVIIVDTFARIKNKPTKGANSYDEDTEVMAPLHRLAVERRVGLVLVTHTRKPPTGRSSSEFLDEIQGSTGITGVADTILGLRKTGDQQVSLFVRGRDVDEQELLIQWDADTSDWTLLGNADHVRLTDLQAEILAALPTDGSPVHYRQVARDVGKTGRGGHEATRIILRRLADRGVVKQLQDGFFSLTLQ